MPVTPAFLRRSVRARLVAAAGSQEIAGGAEIVAGASQDSASRVEQSRGIATELADRAGDLEQRVAQFTV